MKLMKPSAFPMPPGRKETTAEGSPVAKGIFAIGRMDTLDVNVMKGSATKEIPVYRLLLLPQKIMACQDK